MLPENSDLSPAGDIPTPPDSAVSESPQSTQQTEPPTPDARKEDPAPPERTRRLLPQQQKGYKRKSTQRLEEMARLFRGAEELSPDAGQGRIAKYGEGRVGITYRPTNIQEKRDRELTRLTGIEIIGDDPPPRPWSPSVRFAEETRRAEQRRLAEQKLEEMRRGETAPEAEKKGKRGRKKKNATEEESG